MKPANPPFFLCLLCIWLFVSAFYYADTLFSGVFVLDMEEGFSHKLSKYVVCALISFCLILKSRSLFVGGASAIMFSLLVLQLLLLGSPNLFSTTVLTLITMAGLSCTLQIYPRSTRLIARSIVWSAALVGCISGVELTLLAENFISYWTSTGGVRSISTMFNPNNLGLYLGAALILLPWATQSGLAMISLAMPILFGFAVSGSRTAWFSLAVCLLALLLAPKSGKELRRTIFKYKKTMWLVAVGMLAVGSFFINTIAEIGIDSEGRGTDLYTASIRWTNFVAYLEQIDEYSLFPDINDRRVDLIQDNAYLIVFNTFGLILCFILSLTLLNLKRGPPLADNGNLAWIVLFFYYLISGLSGSFINSFPNNQLFFIALGASFVPRSFEHILRSHPPNAATAVFK
jgi:hypothetical protein